MIHIQPEDNEDSQQEDLVSLKNDDFLEYSDFQGESSLGFNGEGGEMTESSESSIIYEEDSQDDIFKEDNFPYLENNQFSTGFQRQKFSDKIQRKSEKMFPQRNLVENEARIEQNSADISSFQQNKNSVDNLQSKNPSSNKIIAPLSLSLNSPKFLGVDKQLTENNSVVQGPEINEIYPSNEHLISNNVKISTNVADVQKKASSQRENNTILQNNLPYQKKHLKKDDIGKDKNQLQEKISKVPLFKKDTTIHGKNNEVKGKNSSLNPSFLNNNKIANVENSGRPYKQQKVNETPNKDNFISKKEYNSNKDLQKYEDLQLQKRENEDENNRKDRFTKKQETQVPENQYEKQKHIFKTEKYLQKAFQTEKQGGNDINYEVNYQISPLIKPNTIENNHNKYQEDFSQLSDSQKTLLKILPRFHILNNKDDGLFGFVNANNELKRHFMNDYLKLNQKNIMKNTKEASNVHDNSEGVFIRDLDKEDNINVLETSNNEEKQNTTLLRGTEPGTGYTNKIQINEKGYNLIPNSQNVKKSSSFVDLRVNKSKSSITEQGAPLKMKTETYQDKDSIDVEKKVHSSEFKGFPKINNPFLRSSSEIEPSESKFKEFSFEIQSHLKLLNDEFNNQIKESEKNLNLQKTIKVDREFIKKNTSVNKKIDSQPQVTKIESQNDKSLIDSFNQIEDKENSQDKLTEKNIIEQFNYQQDTLKNDSKYLKNKSKSSNQSKLINKNHSPLLSKRSINNLLPSYLRNTISPSQALTKKDLQRVAQKILSKTNINPLSTQLVFSDDFYKPENLNESNPKIMKKISKSTIQVNSKNLPTVLSTEFKDLDTDFRYKVEAALHKLSQIPPNNFKEVIVIKKRILKDKNHKLINVKVMEKVVPKDNQHIIRNFAIRVVSGLILFLLAGLVFTSFVKIYQKWLSDGLSKTCDLFTENKNNINTKITNKLDQ